jgi:hypothetical protein
MAAMVAVWAEKAAVKNTVNGIPEVFFLASACDPDFFSENPWV